MQRRSVSAEQQLELLADYIMGQIPGEPSRPEEGTGTCAIRLIKEYRDSLRAIMSELGTPQPNHLAHIANAHKIAEDVLG